MLRIVSLKIFIFCTRNIPLRTRTECPSMTSLNMKHDKEIMIAVYEKTAIKVVVDEQ